MWMRQTWSGRIVVVMPVMHSCTFVESVVECVDSRCFHCRHFQLVNSSAHTAAFLAIPPSAFPHSILPP